MRKTLTAPGSIAYGLSGELIGLAALHNTLPQKTDRIGVETRFASAKINITQQMSDLSVKRFDADTRQTIGALLAQHVHGDSVKFRAVGGGQRAGYLETHHAIEIANSIFKPSGWTSEVRRVETDYVRSEPRRFWIRRPL